MERFLVTLSLGPVQSLIGAARRTRDLWCGSWMLSEASRAAARVLHTRHPGCLIFPCPANPCVDLRPQQQPGDAANIANILRAEVAAPSAADVRALCEDAKAAAVCRLTDLGASARVQLTKAEPPLRDNVWRAQIDDILEVFAAWVPIAEEGDGYQAASQRLGGVLAARKATRDFRPCPPLNAQGLPKSSLDGAFETVLPHWKIGHWARHKLRLSDGEQLDALGVIKRLAGASDQFTAYPRIAADPWIDLLTCKQKQELRNAYEPLVGHDLATRVTGNAKIYDDLPFDAELLYPIRLDNALAYATDPTELEDLGDLKTCIKGISKPAGDEPGAGEPVPYAVILKADGDRMGELLSRADSAERSRKISRALHDEFASKVAGIVRDHRGHAIYAGGDDVLALVPLVGALDCAKDLADEFARSLAKIATDLEIEAGKRPTLSVGLGIGHFMEPLGALRARADRAEHAAKGDATNTPRNALAIALGIRAGAELKWRAQWSDKTALDTLRTLTAAFRDRSLPTRAAYDLRGVDRRLAWLREDDSGRARGMQAAEVARMLARKRTETGEHIPDKLRDLIRKQAKVQPLRELADTLIVARWLSARAAGDLGEYA